MCSISCIHSSVVSVITDPFNRAIITKNNACNFPPLASLSNVFLLSDVSKQLLIHCLISSYFTYTIGKNLEKQLRLIFSRNLH